MLAALTPIFIGMDSRSRRLRLARVVELDPDLRLLGHAPVDHCCLRATIARRPEVLVVAPEHDRGAEAGHVIAGVRRGSPRTAILALLAGDEATADRRLAEGSALDEILRAVHDLARARQVVESAPRRDAGRRDRG